MTSTTRHAEADRVEAVYYWALNQLGNAMAVDSLDLWKQVPATKQAATSAWWLSRLLALLFGFRSEAQDLAVAYYRLTRALRTGFAPTIGSERPGSKTTLERLRQEFEEIVDHIDAETAGDNAPNWNAVSEPALNSLDEDADITLEHVADIDALIEKSNEAATQEAAEYLDAMGIDNMLRKLDDDSLIPEQAHSAAGNRQAAAAMRIMMNAARGLVYDLADTDLRVIGWARYSKTGTPCGWCAMLISRGLVYKSEASAGVASGGAGRTGASGKLIETDMYHDNCRCVAVPIFMRAQFDSDLFSLNRFYDQLWQDRVAGSKWTRLKQKPDDTQLTVWRRLVRELIKQSEQNTTVPEAA